MLMLTDDIEVKSMSQALIYILGIISMYNRKVRGNENIKTVTKKIDGTSFLHNIWYVFPFLICIF